MTPHLTPTLPARVAEARREWECMDVEHTSYAMRHRAEMRYLSLLRLQRLAERPTEPIQAGTPPRTASRWKGAA